MSSNKFFCPKCEYIHGDYQCTKCKGYSVGVGKNDIFPKHPKKSDYEFFTNKFTYYCDFSSALDEHNIDDVAMFVAKHGKPDQLLKVMRRKDQIDNFSKASVRDDLVRFNTISSMRMFDKLPEPFREFLKLLDIKKQNLKFCTLHKEYYVTNANIFYASDHISKNNDFTNIFKVHSTKPYRKATYIEVPNYFEQYCVMMRDKSSVRDPDMNSLYVFEDKSDAMTFSFEIALYLSRNPKVIDKFTEYVPDIKEKIITSMDLFIKKNKRFSIHKRYPEFYL